jgi:hypothetical protein
MEATMRSRILVLAVALVVVLVPAAAIGQTATSHPIDVNLRLAVIADNPPSGNLYAGQVKGKPFGTAAVLARNQVSGTTSTGKAVIYAKRGTITANITSEIQPQPDGSAKFPGTFKVTGGTGLYKSATGKGKFDGAAAAGSTVIVFHVTGKLRY